MPAIGAASSGATTLEATLPLAKHDSTAALLKGDGTAASSVFLDCASLDVSIIHDAEDSGDDDHEEYHEEDALEQSGSSSSSSSLQSSAVGSPHHGSIAAFQSPVSAISTWSLAPTPASPELRACLFAAGATEQSPAPAAIPSALFLTPRAVNSAAASSTQVAAPSSAPAAPLTALKSRMDARSQLAREEELVQLLRTKKRTLLSEIGSLLTLRERLVNEAVDAGTTGVPFDYAARFAASPSTLLALESIADTWRIQQREESAQRERQDREAQKAVSRAATPVAARPATAPAAASAKPQRQPDPSLYSVIPIDTPNFTPISTPIRVTHPRPAAAAPAAAVSVRRVIFPAQPTHSISSSIATARPSTAPSSRPAPVASPSRSNPGAFIRDPAETRALHHQTSSLFVQEESIYLDQVLSSDLEHPFLEPNHDDPYYTHPPPTRNARHQERPHTAGPATNSGWHVASPPQLSSSSVATATPASSEAGFLARKAAALRAAAEEAMQGFGGRTLGAVAEDTFETERKAHLNNSRYLGLHVGQPKHEASHKPPPANSNSTSTSSHHLTPGGNFTAPVVSPARVRHGRALQNITNSSSSAAGRTSQTPAKELQTPAAPIQKRISWS